MLKVCNVKRLFATIKRNCHEENQIYFISVPYDRLHNFGKCCHCFYCSVCWNEIGNIGFVSDEQGSDSFQLLAGNDYFFQILFNPNVHEYIGGLQGDLVGNISFDFNSAAQIPIPSTMLLLGTGLICLAGMSRKTSLKKARIQLQERR